MKRTSTSSWKPLLLGMTALVVAVLVFAGTSGAFAFNPLSEVAAAFASVTGQATVSISKDGSSPSGTVSNHYSGKIAAFKVTVKNVSTSATISNLRLSFTTSTSNVSLSNLVADYQYCFKPGVTYGYGYPGGQCATVVLSPSLNGSQIVLSGNIPVYPQQSSGVVTIYGTLDGKGATKDVTAKVTIAALGASAAGDQCRTIHYGLRNRYGYSKCSPVTPVVSASGSVSLSMKIAKYGYGPTVVPPTVTPPTVTPPVVRPPITPIIRGPIIDRFPTPTP